MRNPLVLILLISVSCGLEPTKIVSNGLYKLENQNDGRFLGAKSNGDLYRGEWRGTPDQKFTFVSENGGWTLTPMNNAGTIPALWKINYVGHGKSQFMNLSSGLCMIGSARVQEGTCNRSDPKQRWNVQLTSP